jgi:ectoine hydroxylase-related dioxygenase (phytanoyl-CoA dioxygenase family)
MLRAAVERDGFAIVPGVLPQREILCALENVSDGHLPRTRAGIRHLMSDRNVAALASDPRLVSIASDVLGGKAIPFRATLFDKNPDANWLVAWHQDTALPLRNRKETPGWGPWSVKHGITYAHGPTHALNRVIALRVHLDDSTDQNGPLRVLPGTHQLGVLSDDEVQSLCGTGSHACGVRSSLTRQGACATYPPVDCLAAQGAVLIMRPLLIHSSSKSQIETPRRVLHIEYADSMLIGDGLELEVA